MRVTVTNPTDQSRPAELLLRPDNRIDRDTLHRLALHYQCDAILVNDEIVSVRVRLVGKGGECEEQ